MGGINQITEQYDNEKIVRYTTKDYRNVKNKCIAYMIDSQSISLPPSTYFPNMIKIVFNSILVLITTQYKGSLTSYF